MRRPLPSRRRRVATAIARVVWAWRLEAALMGFAVLTATMWRVGLAAFAAVGVMLVFDVGHSRSKARQLFSRAHLRRRFGKAMREIRPMSHTGRTPRLSRLKVHPAGYVGTVKYPADVTPTDMTATAEEIAGVLRAQKVRVIRDGGDASRARVMIYQRDPLLKPSPRWPNLDAARLSVWNPIPVGIDENGHPVSLTVIENNVLFGGITRSGKSYAMSMIAATAALDPDAVLVCFDGKIVELAQWEQCAAEVVYTDIDRAIEALDGLVADMNERYHILRGMGLRKIEDPRVHKRTVRLPVTVVLVDELTYYLGGGDEGDDAKRGRLGKRFTSLLNALVSRGAAVGICVVAATQKPMADVVPTWLRHNFASRWAMRCPDPDSSDVVLGRGWANKGYDASMIDQGSKGVGYLLTEGETPVRLRSYFLEDDDIDNLAAKALRIRKHQRLRVVTDGGVGFIPEGA